MVTDTRERQHTNVSLRQRSPIGHRPAHDGKDGAASRVRIDYGDCRGLPPKRGLLTTWHLLALCPEGRRMRQAQVHDTLNDCAGKLVNSAISSYEADVRCCSTTDGCLSLEFRELKERTNKRPLRSSILLFNTKKPEFCLHMHSRKRCILRPRRLHHTGTIVSTIGSFPA